MPKPAGVVNHPDLSLDGTERSAFASGKISPQSTLSKLNHSFDAQRFFADSARDDSSSRPEHSPEPLTQPLSEPFPWEVTKRKRSIQTSVKRIKEQLSDTLRVTLYGMAAEKLNLDVCLSLVVHPDQIQMAQKAGMSLRDWLAKRVDKALDLTAKEYGSRPDYLLIGEPHGKFEYDLAEVNDGRIGKRRGKAPSRRYDLHGVIGSSSREIEKAFMQNLRRQFKVRGLEQSKMVDDQPADLGKGGIPGWISYSAKHLEVTNTDNFAADFAGNPILRSNHVSQEADRILASLVEQQGEAGALAIVFNEAVRLREAWRSCKQDEPSGAQHLQKRF